MILNLIIDAKYTKFEYKLTAGLLLLLGYRFILELKQNI